MRAVVNDRYGAPGVLRLEDVARPVPKEDEVLVKIHATTVTRTDCGLRRGKPFIIRLVFGLRRPRRRVLGSELAGEVEAVGQSSANSRSATTSSAPLGSGSRHTQSSPACGRATESRTSRPV
jgi:NADPH:quinone reductase-like Zn-dependent oxidoreductase